MIIIYYNLCPRLSGRPAWGADGNGDGEYGNVHHDAAAETLQRNIPGRQWKPAQLSGRSDWDGERRYRVCFHQSRKSFCHECAVRNSKCHFIYRANERLVFTLFIDEASRECTCVLTRMLLPSRLWRKARATRRKPWRPSTRVPTKCFSISCLNREIPKKRRSPSPGRYGPS